MSDKAYNLIYLCPQIHRPQKVNFAGKFHHLSAKCTGYIFTRCNARHRNLAIGNFRLYSTAIGSNLVTRVLNAMWAQLVLPLSVLRRNSQIDVVVSYDPYLSGLCGVILKYLLGAKLIVEVNGDYHRRPSSEHTLKAMFMSAILHVTVRFSNAMKVLNRDQELYYRAQFPRKPIYLFHDFAAAEYFLSLESFQGDYLLSVGHPFALKGMDILICAFRSIANRHRRMRLKIMGYCPERDMIRYKELAGNDGRIEFIKPGWVEDVGEQLRGAYALVNAARSEAMGRIHLEAMACRKPIVATRTNGGMECIEDGQTGLLSEVGDSGDLANKLDYILSSPDVARRMGEAGLEKLRKEFSEQEYASSFLDMIEKVSGSNRDGH